MVMVHAGRPPSLVRGNRKAFPTRKIVVGRRDFRNGAIGLCVLNVRFIPRRKPTQTLVWEDFSDYADCIER